MVSKMSICRSEGTNEEEGVFRHISIPTASEEGKDNFNEAVLSTCFPGSDGQNVAGITGSQAVPGKYADIIGGGVHLQDGGIGLIRAKLHNCLGGIPGGCVGNGKVKNESVSFESRNESLTIKSLILQDETRNGAVPFKPGSPDQRKHVVLDLLQLNHWGVWWH